MHLLQTTDYLKDISGFLDKRTSINQHCPNKLKKIIGDSKFINYRDKKLKTSYLVDILHSLTMKYHNSKKYEFNLSSIILKERYGQFYNYYINWLIENSFISLSSNYFVGKKTKTFKINIDLIKDSGRYINNDRTLLKRYKNNILSLNIEKTNYNWIDRDVRKKIVSDLFYVEVDIDKANKILKSLKGNSLNKNEFAVDCVMDKHIFFHFDKYGRCHTNFTTMKSNIRKECLMIDGQEIEEIDIRNSQPLFLCLLIGNSDGDLIHSNEFRFFKDLVINGEFYSYYMVKNNISEKKKAKKSIYKVLFGKNIDDDENRNFKTLFPNIFKFILEYKKVNNDYRSLAYALQRSESNFLYNNVIKQIMDEHPEIKLFTVHDSISYPKRFNEVINDIFYHNINLLFN